MMIISCHADTNFKNHELRKVRGGYHGHLDNFAGVHAVMNAYFSGKLVSAHTRIVLTDHEETTFQGALETREEISASDLVVVVDVTGIIGKWDFTVEKCTHPSTEAFLKKTFSGFKYKLFHNSPDPIADQDEVDVYQEKCPYTFFLGIPCSGGDYNHETVTCTKKSLDAVSNAIIAISRAYPKFREIYVK